MASTHETRPYVGPQVSAGRQALDAVCVAVLVLLLTWAASAIAHVPGPSEAPGHGHAGKAADDCETAKPVAQTASAENPLGGMAAVAECEDGKAPGTAAPAHGAPAQGPPAHGTPATPTPQH